MQDEDAATTPATPATPAIRATPEQMTLGGETEPTPEDLQAAELSRAAREAVRQPADPRIDRQIARMGLASDESTVAETPRAARAVRADEVERLGAELAATRQTLADAEHRLARADRRLNLLTWAVTLEGIAVAILAVLLLLR